MLSAREAATAVGMTKAGIIRSIHTGKLSATRNGNGEFVIDAAELFRVYEPLSTGDNSNGKKDEELTPAQCEKVSMLERILIKAIHAGRLSARREPNGAFTIQPVELLRVFTVANEDGLGEWPPLGDGNGAEMNSYEHLASTGSTMERVEVKLLRELLAAKDDVIRMGSETISAQAATIDVLTQENARLAAVVAQMAPPKAKAGWWQRLLGGNA